MPAPKYHIYMVYIPYMSGKVRVKMAPWKNVKYLHPAVKDYMNYEFFSKIYTICTINSFYRSSHQSNFSGPLFFFGSMTNIINKITKKKLKKSICRTSPFSISTLSVTGLVPITRISHYIHIYIYIYVYTVYIYIYIYIYTNGTN